MTISQIFNFSDFQNWFSLISNQTLLKSLENLTDEFEILEPYEMKKSILKNFLVWENITLPLHFPRYILTIFLTFPCTIRNQ